MKTALITVMFLVLLGASVAWMIYAWTSIDAAMTGHGWIALILSVIVSVVVGGGLMALIFYSSRRGYDEPPNVQGYDKPSDSES